MQEILKIKSKDYERLLEAALEVMYSRLVEKARFIIKFLKRDFMPE